ncbi:hypothetical protein OGAPHI_000330 [Ogataea philodendri]|uniref:Nucleolar complex protein 14 n=1 Tax=Ogataea philodendri TaxID=1378263 RepID=A0A9P8TA87_9ASCO|nr:uncharacterized protein OGAPHI_000330 [Ogataea philodendri]KAH3671626.1 hypothetical protein OGAPHI_000330 [Ogataea philodendri]
MAGSQLKQLKASLKSAGLVGQTNTKQKGKRHSKKTPNESRKDDKQKVLSRIREEFNPFDVKVTRNKREDMLEKKKVVGRPGISKQVGEENRRAAFEAKRARKNKAGGLVDRRFGENNSALTAEEKMLERFVKERQAQSSRSSMYNLEDDDDNALTHYGQSLMFDQDGNEDEDEGDFFSQKEQAETTGPIEEEPLGRKKTKQEVMQEIIAKSKHYKRERQKLAEETQYAVQELDEDFENVMGTLNTVPQPKGRPASKTEAEKQYDMKVKTIALDRRAAPADRTKTEEEIEKERKEKQDKMEADRLRRMEGESDDEHGGADDLDDVWEGASDLEEDVEAGSEVEVSSEDEHAAVKPSVIRIGDKVVTVTSTVKSKCPATLDELLTAVAELETSEVSPFIVGVFKKYQPKLASGNKEKIGVFSCVLVQYMLHLGDNYDPRNAQLLDFLARLIKNMCEKYPEELCQEFRGQLQEIQQILQKRDFGTLPRQRDLLLFTLIGATFSTSDLYHLVVTPASLLIGEMLEVLQINTKPHHLFAGIYLTDLLLQYQRLSKRLVPEAVNFLERALLALAPEPQKIDSAALCVLPKPTKFTLATASQLPAAAEPLALADWKKATQAQRENLLLKAVQTVDQATGLLKESGASVELLKPFETIMKHLVKYYASSTVPTVLAKLQNLVKIARVDRQPLKLQAHRAMAIPSYLPKFEENFNPDKKSYDPDQTRQEISKLRHQVKQERKQSLREIRKDSQFEAREQLKLKRKDYQEYHSKMASIINSIQTQEGQAKNEYEREKKRRKN